ncbi:MAG: hypothetical protein QOE59_5014 [Actinomycetota bacterium]|nr:hypothetical protein [Actinomycetota bacterium]
MDPLRKTAIIAGALYLITFATSIPTLVLFAPVQVPGYILGAGPASGVLWGVLLNVICALAGAGTAVALFPVVKRQNEALAIGFVASRVIEGTLIVVGAVCLLSLVTLRQDLAGAAGVNEASLITGGALLLAVHGWTFVLGQSLMPVVNALLLGTLLYKSRLVPRVIPVLGLIGAPLLFASVTATIFGAFGQISPVATIAALPIAVWEFSLGVWLVIKGFTYSPITAGTSSAAVPPDRGETV